MNNASEAFIDSARWVVRALARHRWLVLAAQAVAALSCGTAVMLTHDRYEANARVYVDTQTVLKPLMAALTFQPDIDQQVAMLARTLISRPNVERLASLPGLQPAVPGPAAREELIARLMNRIRIAPTATGNLFEIAYRDTDPERAQRVVQATVQLFVDSGWGAKRRDTLDAGRFIDAQIRGHEEKLVEAENRLKEFKIRNFGVSGVSNQDYFTRVSTQTEEWNKLRSQLSALEQSREAYRRELASEEARVPAEMPARAGEGGELAARLDAQRRQLDELLRRYTEDHPDVVVARRVIARLEAEVRERREAAVRGSDASTASAASPVYQKLRISLADTEAQLASLRSQLATQQARLDQTKASAGRLPQVEAELAQLNRDYDVIRKNYELLVARRESASLGEKMDESSQLAEFRIVEPARVSPRPVFPGRVHLAVLAIVVSLACGCAAALLADLLRPTFDDVASLRRLSGRAVLGTVSLLGATPALRSRHPDLLRFGGVLLLLMAMQAAWLGWLAWQASPMRPLP